ncbi:fimbrial chaperone [Salmonella enterica]|nr:fimbrial chaperone [Salmonella enterica]ECB3945188.1 fimbrial chaperone [Salmonella enterica subsp. enterica serovar Stanley]
MNKLGKVALAVLMSLTISGQAMAAFVLNSTRYIYEEGKKNITFEVTNQSDKTYGGQVWVDNTGTSTDVYLVPAPPVFKIAGKEKQIVRIMKVSDALPSDRETLFWLNVQEIPPKPTSADGENTIALAMNTRVKIFYRPKALEKGRENAEKKLQFISKDGVTWLENPTPYYIAVTKVLSGKQAVALSEKVMGNLAKLAPFSKISLGKKVSGSMSIEAINDWGGVQSYAIQ